MNSFLKFLPIAFLSSFYSFSQIQVTNTMTPTQLVNNILVGSGITATNITVNGSSANASTIQVNASYFNQNGTSFPFSEGVLLTTGNGSVAAGPNDSGSATNNAGTSLISDVDLNAIASSSITNGIVLEFDFIATGDTLVFNYVFGSEEYTEFSPSSYNDVFGFFLSGTGISGPYSNGAVNIATLPGTTTPVTINNVNQSANTAYFVDNEDPPFYYGNAIQYDGTTVTLTATASLICGGLYHIKLGIANVGDQSFDSGVFLEARSFLSNTVAVELNPSISGSFTDTLLAEGCVYNVIDFIRPSESDTVAVTIPLHISGTVNIASDLTSAFQDTVFFPIGVDTVSIMVNPIDDF